MLDEVNDFQIFNPVIKFVAIDVVNVLCRQQRTPKCRLHDTPVVEHSLAVRSAHAEVPVGGEIATSRRASDGFKRVSVSQVPLVVHQAESPSKMRLAAPVDGAGRPNANLVERAATFPTKVMRVTNHHASADNVVELFVRQYESFGACPQYDSMEDSINFGALEYIARHTDSLSYAKGDV